MLISGELSYRYARSGILADQYEKSQKSQLY